MTKVIYIAGPPASGKTTLLRKVRDALFIEQIDFRWKKVRGVHTKDNRLWMLGVFDGTITEGTDRLSMSVIDDATRFCKLLPDKASVFIEGDRLFCERFIRETSAVLFIIDATEDVLLERHIQRGDNQSETFIRSRRTKVENYIKKHGCQRWDNSTPEKQTLLLNAIFEEVV